MCAGGQKWDHLGINEFAPLFHSEKDEPNYEGFELLDHTSLMDHCTLGIETEEYSEHFLQKQPSQLDTDFSERLSSCSVALFNITNFRLLHLLAF